MNRLLVRAGLCVAVLLGLLSCAQPRPSGEMRIATGGNGGVYFAYGQGLAKAVREHLPGLRPEVLETAASLDNLRRVSSGEAEMAFSLADSVALAVSGEPPFDSPQPVRTLARLYENYVHLVVAADTDIHSLADLRGHAVSTGAAGSGTEVIVERLLEVSGVDSGQGHVDRHQLDLDTSVRALKAGRVSAFFFSSGLPARAIRDLARTHPIRLVDLADQVGPMRDRYGELYSERSIPRSMYGLPATATIGVPNYLIVHRDMDEQLAYELTRLLFVARDELADAHREARRLNKRAAFSTYPAALHPGAVRYYRQARKP
ncbi:TAXI family TRAP transporter solute-binding subunit [Streptomyces sp. E11-3]|uniref:TAXI family TRAP transporter solute-binding subunit n=1 Tax=Streptomyces sp. E11-3 TaxID=3110112 RepID=UPI003980762A